MNGESCTKMVSSFWVHKWIKPPKLIWSFGNHKISLSYVCNGWFYHYIVDIMDILTFIDFEYHFIDKEVLNEKYYRWLETSLLLKYDLQYNLKTTDINMIDGWSIITDLRHSLVASTLSSRFYIAGLALFLAKSPNPETCTNAISAFSNSLTIYPSNFFYYYTYKTPFLLFVDSTVCLKLACFSKLLNTWSFRDFYCKQRCCCKEFCLLKFLPHTFT